ncbi:hypothetical protein BC830DRAFT_1076893 [Chytriomyces sp. MP71]|nr:hypothetical protein BC830DRAFT_1076893 [Chytriomyces sp. MP71]
MKFDGKVIPECDECGEPHMKSEKKLASLCDSSTCYYCGTYKKVHGNNNKALALDVKNYLLIEQLEIEFAHGLKSEVLYGIRLNELFCGTMSLRTVHKASTSTAGFVAYKSGTEFKHDKETEESLQTLFSNEDSQEYIESMLSEIAATHHPFVLVPADWSPELSIPAVPVEYQTTPMNQIWMLGSILIWVMLGKWCPCQEALVS